MSSNNVMWNLFLQSDTLTRLILLSLLLISSFCFLIIIDRFVFLRKEANCIKKINHKLHVLASLKEIQEAHAKSDAFLTRSFFEKTVHLLPQQYEDAPLSLSPEEKEQIEIEHGQIIDALILEGEGKLPFLGVSAAVAPLIGLFGTVWGLIHAFLNISQEKSADLVVVAPGIAEALITTLAGLFVAIIALVFFHYFSNKLRTFEQALISSSHLIISFLRNQS